MEAKISKLHGTRLLRLQRQFGPAVITKGHMIEVAIDNLVETIKATRRGEMLAPRRDVLDAAERNYDGWPKYGVE